MRYICMKDHKHDNASSISENSIIHIWHYISSLTCETLQVKGKKYLIVGTDFSSAVSEWVPSEGESDKNITALWFIS